MITSTVKLPEDLVARIDERIESKEFSTRADFVLHALRLTVSRYTEIKRELIRRKKSEIPEETEVAIEFNTYFKEFFIEYQEFKGNPVQINTRVPEGLDQRIDILVKPEYGFKKKTDFTRIAVMYLLLVLNETDGVFQYAEEFAAKQKAVTEIFNQLVKEGLSEGKNMEQILNETRATLREKGFR